MKLHAAINGLRRHCCRRRPYYPHRTLLALAAAALPAIAARAGDNTYVGADGPWSDPTAWTLGRAPLAGDIVLLQGPTAVAANTTVTLDTSPGTLSSLTIDTTVPGASITLSQDDFSLAAGSETIGNTGVGNFSQSGGSHGVNNELDIASGVGGRGTYNMTGGTLTVPFMLAVGFNDGATGTVNQSGGTISTFDLNIADNSTTAVGNYMLSATGLLSVQDDVYVGASGAGTFTQTGGANQIQGSLFIGYANFGPGSRGSYALSAGVVSAANVFVGGSDFAAGAPGVLSVSGSGSLTASGTLKVWASGTNGITLAGGTISAGALDLSGDPSRLTWTAGTLNLTNSSLTIGSGGVLGSNLDLPAAKALGVSGTVSVSAGSTLSISGGQLAAGALANAGTFSVTSGSASLGGLSGTGLTSIGGGVGGSGAATNAALVVVDRFDQSSLTINDGGKLQVRQAFSRVTNTAGTLQLNGSTATLDLANHDLITTATPTSTIRGYLLSAYTANQDWSGPGGITSSLAKASPAKYTLAYAAGSDQSAQDVGLPVAPGQTLVRPALVGDANLDGRVDFFDIAQVLGYKYNTGQAASYTDGDLNYDGKVDFFDISTLLSANYNSGEVFAAPLASAAKASARPAALSGGKPGFDYDPATGDLVFRTHGAAFPSTVGALAVSSAQGILHPFAASAALRTGAGATLSDTLIASTSLNGGGFLDAFDLGRVLPVGLSAAQLASAGIEAQYQVIDEGALQNASIAIVPEPGGLCVISLGAASLLHGRRRRRR
jgi:hypothetical protein